MEYLSGLGHKRIGLISGRMELESTVRRMKGYRDALQSAGIEIDPSLIVEGNFTTKTAYECTQHLLGISEPPTAIFATNDQSAIGVYQAVEEIGVRIPEDLSVVGFDNISEAKFMGLTTVDQFLADMGYIATQMLIKLIHGEQLEEKIHKIETKLILRNSCRSLF
jgi:LacI family transcriptional regulator